MPDSMPGEYRLVRIAPIMWNSALPASKAARVSQAATPFPRGACAANAIVTLKNTSKKFIPNQKTICDAGSYLRAIHAPPGLEPTGIDEFLEDVHEDRDRK